jgi:hypothetical protein
MFIYSHNIARLTGKIGQQWMPHAKKIFSRATLGTRAIDSIPCVRQHL